MKLQRIKLIGTKFKSCRSVLILRNLEIISINVAGMAVVMDSLHKLLRQPYKTRMWWSSSSWVGAVILVIFIAVNNGYQVMGSSASSDLRIKSAPSLTVSSVGSLAAVLPKSSHRNPRQMNSFISSTLRTMGCIPKFFCGMTAKNPSTTSSTMNDLAYLIKFAMTDLDGEELGLRKDQKRHDRYQDDSSGEDVDPQLRTDSEERKENERIEELAEELAIKDDPGLLKFMRLSGKQKYNGRMDKILAKEAMLEAVLEERDRLESEEEENKSKSKIGSLLTGVKNMFRLGKSWNFSNRGSEKARKKRKAFWESKEFRQQMLLAAKVAESEKYKAGNVPQDDDPPPEPEVCSSTFDLCPYNYRQMMGMIKGEPEKKTESTTTTPPPSAIPAASSIMLNGVSYQPVSFLNPGGGQQQLSQTIPMMTQPQPIIYVVHPENMMGLNFNSNNSTPTPVPPPAATASVPMNKKTYSVKPKPTVHNSNEQAYPLQDNNDDDEQPQIWTDSYFKEKKYNKTTQSNNAFNIVQKQQLGIWRNKTQRPSEDEKSEENYHKFSMLNKRRPNKRPTTARPSPESGSDSGSDENEDKLTKQSSKRVKQQEPQNNSEASQSQEEDQPSYQQDQTSASSASEEDDDENEANGPIPPVHNSTINKEPSKHYSLFENNDSTKDTSSSSEDEDKSPPDKFTDDDRTSEEDESEEEERIVWADKTTTTSTTTSTPTTTTPVPRRKTNRPKYKPRPKLHNVKRKQKPDSGQSLEKSWEESQVKMKHKGEFPKRRPSSPPNQDKNQQNYPGSRRSKPRRKLSKTRITTSTSTITPPQQNRDDSDDETLEESSEEEGDLEAPPPTPTIPTTTRKPRPSRPPSKFRPSSSTTPSYNQEPEYGSLPQLSDLSSNSDTSLNGLPAPSSAPLGIIPTPSTYSTTMAAPQDKPTVLPTFSFLSLTTSASNLLSPTVSPINLIAAIAQASKVKKVFGAGNKSPFGVLLSNILNSSSTAQVLQGVETDLPTSSGSASEEAEPEPNLTTNKHHNNNKNPLFWKNFRVQQKYGQKITQPVKQNVQHQPSHNHGVPAQEQKEVVYERPPIVQHQIPRPQNVPQMHYQNVQEMMYTVEPYQFPQQQPFNNPQQMPLQQYPYQYQLPHPEQQQQQQWPSSFYPSESWHIPIQKPFQQTNPQVPIRTSNVPTRRRNNNKRRPSTKSASSREQGRDPHKRPSRLRPKKPTKSKNRQSVRRRPTGERVRVIPKTRYQQRQGEEEEEEPIISLEEVQSNVDEEEEEEDQQNINDNVEEEVESPPVQHETEIEIKEVLLDKQQKLQLEFAERLHDLAKHQLILAQRQVFQKPSSKEK